jgi:hypothetical protein
LEEKKGEGEGETGMNGFIFKLLTNGDPMYPENFKFPDTAHHLLFDVGYSYACLSRAEALLTDLLATAKTGKPINEMEEGNIEELIAVLGSLRRGRLKVIDDLYEAGSRAAQRLDKGPSTL